MSDLMALSNFSLPINFISNAAAAAMVEPSCVCSPSVYTFTLNLNQNCETNTFTDNPGISNAVCQLQPGSIDSADTLIVYDVQFLEVDTSGNLIVINQDDTYNNVSLTTGDTITFDSVSANLNSDEPLSNQINYVPGGVLMKLVAKNEGSDTIVRQQVSWLYTNSCDDLPSSVGDAIGWVTLTDQTEASSAFCPVTATNSPTTSPTQSPTAAPAPGGCSCSPRDFTFQLQLDRDCDTNTISGSPGVEIAVCNRKGGADVTDFSSLVVVDIQFLELNDLTVINQNDTFTNTSLASGDTFSFPSISNMLSPGTPIGEQEKYYPTEVTLILEGKVKDDDGNEVAVRNQVAWSYTEDCNILPISVGQSIGWVDITDQTEASQAFCTVASSTMPTPSPTKTATVSPTTSPVVATNPPTTSPTQSPTPAPVASTDPPITSSMSLSLSHLMGKGNKRQKEQNTSSKSNKASKAATKAQKTSSKATSTSSTSLSVLI